MLSSKVGWFGVRSSGASAFLSVAAAALLFAVCLDASGQNAPRRPRITGISHVGYFASDLPRTVSFWHDFLGFDQYYSLKAPGTDRVRIAFFRINDRQHIEIFNIEIFNEPPAHPPSMMSHLCFAVDNVEQMKDYLRAKGIPVKGGPPHTTHTGDYAFEIQDPDGTVVEFAQSLPSGAEAQTAGKFAPPARVADSIYHVGFIVGNSAKSIAFYRDLLGFRETWRGASDPRQLSWINLQVPDGTDYIELMLYRDTPTRLGTMNHVSLLVPNIEKAVAELKSRPYDQTYGKPLEIHVGKNGKRQVNLYDPDGTRVELMEPGTVDGKPVPSSTAPPPPPAHE